jgi:hypothetical protein
MYEVGFEGTIDGTHLPLFPMGDILSSSQLSDVEKQNMMNLVADALHDLSDSLKSDSSIDPVECMLPLKEALLKLRASGPDRGGQC